MPVVNVPALATGTDNAWALFSGANKVAAINTDDADTSAIISTTLDQMQGFTPDYASVIPGGAGGVGVLNALTVSAKAYFSGGAAATINQFVRLAGSYTHAGDQALTGAYVLYTSAVLARPGGGSYVQTDVAGLEWGFRYRQNPADASSLVTWGYMTVNYLPIGGGFIPFFLSLAGIGAGIGLEHMPAIAGALARSGRAILTPAEWAPALLELQGHRYPRTFYPRSLK